MKSDFEIDKHGNLIDYHGTDQQVYIPYGVTSIQNKAFFACPMRSVFCSDTVIKIGQGFYLCTSLTEIWFSKSVKEVDAFAFENCDAMRNFMVAEDNPYFTSFEGCLYNKDMTELILCPNAKTSIFLPDSVKKVNNRALYECTELKEITVSDGNPYFTSNEGVLYDKEFHTLLNCPKNKISVIIPEGVTEIAPFAFSNCSVLTEISIPNSITAIKTGFEWHWLFQDCPIERYIYHGVLLLPYAWDSLKNLTGRQMFFFSNLSAKDYLDMIDTRNFLLPDEIAYGIVWSIFSHDPEDTSITEYIKKNFEEMILYLIHNKDTETLALCLLSDHAANITETNMKKFIMKANQKQVYEIQVLLMDYQQKHLQPDDFLKKFAL